jgi:hypothetical protein
MAIPSVALSVVSQPKPYRGLTVAAKNLAVILWYQDTVALSFEFATHTSGVYCFPG